MNYLFLMSLLCRPILFGSILLISAPSCSAESEPASPLQAIHVARQDRSWTTKLAIQTISRIALATGSPALGKTGC